MVTNMNEDLPPIDQEHLDALLDELDMKTDPGPAKREKNIEKEEIVELITKNPIKKFNFIYNELLCMTRK